MKKNRNEDFFEMVKSLSRFASKGVYSLCVGALSAYLFSSCTVDGPSGNFEGEADNYLISSVTSFGMSVMAFEYDNLNRPTTIKVADGELFTFKYSDNSDTPVSICTEHYDIDNNSQWVVDQQDVLTNIRFNDKGHIVSYDIEETDYDIYDNTHRKDWGHAILTYDQKGHLTCLTTHYEATGQEPASTEVVSYTWENELLKSWGDMSGEDHREWWTAEYSNMENSLMQWDPLNEVFGPIACTGWFGNAPKKFMSKTTCHESYQGEVQESYEQQYSFALNNNNLIKAVRIFHDELMTYNFIYNKKK